jgi:hypothetical protein
LIGKIRLSIPDREQLVHLVEVENVADLVLVVALVLLVQQGLHGSLHGAGDLTVETKKFNPVFNNKLSKSMKIFQL